TPPEPGNEPPGTTPVKDIPDLIRDIEKRLRSNGKTKLPGISITGHSNVGACRTGSGSGPSDMLVAMQCIRCDELSLGELGDQLRRLGNLIQDNGVVIIAQCGCGSDIPGGKNEGDLIGECLAKLMPGKRIMLAPCDVHWKKFHLLKHWGPPGWWTPDPWK